MYCLKVACIGLVHFIKHTKILGLVVQASVSKSLIIIRAVGVNKECRVFHSFYTKVIPVFDGVLFSILKHMYLVIARVW